MFVPKKNKIYTTNNEILRLNGLNNYRNRENKSDNSNRWNYVGEIKNSEGKFLKFRGPN